MTAPAAIGVNGAGAPVPAPATGALLLAGLGALAGLGRRRAS
ncbi:MAG: PEP-CTERM sorting domain-containing protein [Burkholderiales bacterium]|nr:PEP-CTERM sorting domain-containing protein [Burkholderiales bacterium]